MITPRGHEKAGQADLADQRPGHLRPVPDVAPGAVHGGGQGVQRVGQRRSGGLGRREHFRVERGRGFRAVTGTLFNPTTLVSRQ